MNIAVFKGGSSREREVSLMSGDSIYAALQQAGHTVTAYDVAWEGKNTLLPAIDEIVRKRIDVVFLALHGGLGENGGIQGLLEAAGIPYTGSGITASAVAMDKDLSKAIFRYHDIPTAPWIAGSPETITPSRVLADIGYPCVVKPADQGSTIGVVVVRDPSRLEEAIATASPYTEKVMVEQYISGKELSVPILGETALPVIEIRPSHEIYDYTCKYTSGMSEYFVPAPIPANLAEEITGYALKVFAVLGLRDIARIDFRLDADGRPLCFEANTLPGMTNTSLVPKSAAKAGIDFPGLVTRITEQAYQRKGKAADGA
ncbi:D-alanine--D-alanine ligase [bacterium]|nr:D-alanine--D-alanine ligase [bacterium]